MEEGDKGEEGGGGEAYPLPTPSYIQNLTQTLVYYTFLWYASEEIFPYTAQVHSFSTTLQFGLCKHCMSGVTRRLRGTPPGSVFI